MFSHGHSHGGDHERLRNEEDDENGTAQGQPESRVSIVRVVSLSLPQWKMLTVATVALGVSVASNLAIPLYLGQIIDAVTSMEDFDVAKAALIRAVSGLFFFFLVSAAFSMLRAALYTIAGYRVVSQLRRDLFSSILYQEIGFFDGNRTGELTNRLSSDTEVIQNAVSANISMLLRHFATVILGVAFLFYISWKLSLIMIGVLPPLMGLSVWYGQFMRKLTKEVQKSLAEATEIAEESFSNVRTVRAFAQELQVCQKYNNQIEVGFQLAKKRAYGFGGYTAIVGLFANVFLAGILYYGAMLVLRGELTTGTLTSYILYTITVAASLGILASLYGDFMKAVGASERVFELIDRVPTVNAKGGRELATVEGEVRFTDVHFHYPTRKDVPVLEGVSLHLAPGKVVALVGPSGGGKSTVVHLVERFYDVVAGSVTLDNTDVRELDPKWLRSNIGLVSQEPVLFATSIRDNIRFGRPTASDDDVTAAAKMANAHSFIAEFPDGYNTLVGERGVRLSGGQKQRVAIARAILMNPRILLLDEATSALDAESEHLVQEALDRLMEGRTVLVVAHRLSTVREADEVVVIMAGKVVERGTHDELVSRDGAYKKLISRQQMGGVAAPSDAILFDDSPADM